MDHQVDKAYILSSYSIEGGRVHEIVVPAYVETDERGVLLAVWSA